MPPKKTKPTLPAFTAEEAQRYAKIINAAILDFGGNADELESAIGLLYVGRAYGWRVLVLLHTKRTIRKYEKILNIDVRKFFEEEGPLAGRSIAYGVAKAVGNFWKAVSGEYSVPRRKEFNKE